MASSEHVINVYLQYILYLCMFVPDTVLYLINIFWWADGFRETGAQFSRALGNTFLKKIIIAIYSTMIYTAPLHNVLDVCISIRRASGRGLGPGNGEFFRPVKWHHYLGPKNSRFPEPNPLPSNGYECIQIIMHRAVWVHRWFYAQEPTSKVSGSILWDVGPGA